MDNIKQVKNEIIDDIIESLEQDGAFKNPFLEKIKFRKIFKKKLFNLKLIDIYNNLSGLVNESIKECISTNLDETAERLKNEGLISESITSDGLLGYVVNEKKDE